MIAHPLKTVFVHIPKTAGTSVEQVFLSYLGLDQNSRAALLLREKLEYESGPPRLAHLTTEEYLDNDFITPEQREDYFFFATVRNPWARVQSCYHFLNFDHDHSLNDFVANQLEKKMNSAKYGWFLRPQTDFIYDKNDQLLVDTVCRFEQLQADFNAVHAKVGLPPTELPVSNSRQVKVSENSKNRAEKCSLNPASIEIIARLYKRDVELLGYDYSP